MITVQHNRKITISVAGNRKSTSWSGQQIWISELLEKLKIPARSTETLVQYLRLSKVEQDDLKDVGGFVGGTIKGNRRKADNVTGRDILTLDLDSIPAGGTQDILRRLESLGCAYVVYSTRKHEEARPRLRVLIPLDRTATADEYEPLARKMAAFIGMEFCDPTTFQVHRLMYWPSCCSDSQYIYQYADKPFVSADGLLSMYKDWKDMSEWPQVPGVQQDYKRLATKQGDPTEKKGVVGAFCRVYDVYKVMEELIPGEYEPCGEDGRYTYTGGSTTGGAIVYDNGKFLFSHHATDPAGGKLCNAFDLVRLHKFGDKDEEVKPGTLIINLPSYKAMCEFAISDSSVAALLNQERYEKATQEFAVTVDGNVADDNPNWMSLLERNLNTGMPLKTTRNIQMVLMCDPLLKNRIYKNTFTNRLMGIAPLPWGARHKQEGSFQWSDDDDAGLLIYLDLLLNIQNVKIIKYTLQNHAAANQRNPVVEYLTGLKWDGVPRLDTLYIDYLGAEDCPFIRTITRKAFIAAVARAMTDNVKFDNMTVICGPQRIGKSTLFRKIGKDWFTDSIKTFEGKETEEIIEGKWIVEIAELQALNKVDINRVKQFLSKVDDQYRAAYGHNVKTQIRRCVFFGTTNDIEYLRDKTGNRRFWPVNAKINEPTKSIHDGDLDSEIDQIWAEAFVRWQTGEPLHLSDEMEEEADRRRESHMEQDPLQGQIEVFLEKPIPEDWDNWSLERRNMFWNGGMTGGPTGSNLKLVPRNKVCALEIWKECLYERRIMSKADSSRINDILQGIPGWERVSTARFGVNYGRQRGFKKVKIDIQNVNKVVKIGENVNIPKNGIVNNVNSLSTKK